MNYIDIIIAIPLIYALYRGWKKGLIIEVATLIALILGIFLAVNYSDYTKDVLTDKLDISSNYIGFLAFIITFISVVVIINIIGKYVSKMMHAISLGFINRIFGALFSFAKFLIILCIFVALFEGLDRNVGIVKKEIKVNSKLYYPIYDLAMGLHSSFNIGELTDEVKKTTDKLIQ